MDPLAKGQPLIKNAKLDSLYIVQAGSVDVVVHPKKDPASAKPGEPPRRASALKNEKFGPGGFFGEGALMGDADAQPPMSAKASEPSSVLRITHAAFRRHVGALQEIRREQVNVKALSSIPELTPLNLAERRHIAKARKRGRGVDRSRRTLKQF